MNGGRAEGLRGAGGWFALLAMQTPRPVPIQRYALPLFVDMLAQVQTGSGKICLVIIPSRLLTNASVVRTCFPGQMAQASPVALRLSPTRELAIRSRRTRRTSSSMRAAT